MVAIDPARSPGETRTSGITGSVLAELAGYASGLPKTVHYFDDYHEVDRHIRVSDPEWRICLNGQTSVFRVGSIDTAYRHLLHALATTGLPSAPRGTALAFGHFFAHPVLLQRTVEAAVQGPLVGLSFVRRELATLAPHAGAVDGAKALLRVLGRLAWFGWTEDDLHALRQIHNPLASPQRSPVADGEALLSLAEQCDISEHFEELALRISLDPQGMPWQDLRAAAMLLFSAGVSDTVITHRFGLKTVAQSHEYDNRTLAQHLTDIEVPADALDVLEGPALDAFRIIETGRAEGELVSRFKALQSSDGDDSALAFLAEAVDQVQLTPYGVCTASFVSEPCPKHLTCLNGCSHLVRTADAKTVENNRKFLARYEALLDQCPSAETANTAQKAWREKLETDVVRLRGLVATAPGQQVFPNGDDRASPYTPRPEGLR